MLATLNNAQPLTQALRNFFPVGRTGNPVALSTGLRWVHRGVVGPGGERVYLEATKVGGVFYVSLEAAENFIAALNADRPVSQTQTDADVTRRAKSASDALAAFGI